MTSSDACRNQHDAEGDYFVITDKLKIKATVATLVAVFGLLGTLIVFVWNSSSRFTLLQVADTEQRASIAEEIKQRQESLSDEAHQRQLVQEESRKAVADLTASQAATQLQLWTAIKETRDNVRDVRDQSKDTANDVKWIKSAVDEIKGKH